ncbi:MAG: TraR/DksA family transcriptional regulator [Phycisphaerae bacterium]|jgi:DnaK suppressor protein|nr:TraR/DksA family transcriptional regulator [Phycisphaerae bacterium]
MATKASTKTKNKTEDRGNKNSFEQFKKLLLKRKEELASSVKNHVEELPDTGMEGAAGDTSDRASADYTSEMFGVLLQRQAGTLEEVERALTKIEKGEFGICEACEKTIPAKRIKALPWARFCLECQQVHDRKQARRSSSASTDWDSDDD